MHKRLTGAGVQLVLALMLLTIASCRHDDLLTPKPNENIRPAADFIRNNFDFRILYAALEYTGLVNELNNQSPITVLAPTDDCFRELGILNEMAVTRLNKDSLREALRFHVLKSRRLLLADIPTNGVDVQFETLSGKSVLTTGTSRTKDYFFNGCRVVRENITLSNGVLHVLNKIMKYGKGSTVQNHLEAKPEYSLFVAGLKKFGLWEELSGAGPYTVYAPINEAFEEKGITLATINSLNVEGYDGRRLFGAYVLESKHFFVSDQYVFQLLGGSYFYKANLKNDDWYLQFTVNLQRNNPGDMFATPYPEVSLWQPGPTQGSLPVLIGEINQVYGAPKPVANYDHLLENGLVHKMHGVLTVPADVIKQQ